MSTLPPVLDAGEGPPLVLMQGFGLRPRTYAPVVLRLAERFRVLVPSLFDLQGTTWSASAAVSAVRGLLDERGLGPVTVVGHSFGGALQLELAAGVPEMVEELVFVDTLAMSREWTLAAEAGNPVHLLWMATPRAAIDFLTTTASSPSAIVRAAWWGFRSDRKEQVQAVAEAGIRSHVLWANRDSLLSRADGQSFAHDLRADFRVVQGSGGGPVDHDWIYRHPALFMDQIDQLGLKALTEVGGGEKPLVGEAQARTAKC